MPRRRRRQRRRDATETTASVNARSSRMISDDTGFLATLSGRGTPQLPAFTVSTGAFAVEPVSASDSMIIRNVNTRLDRKSVSSIQNQWSRFSTARRSRRAATDPS